MPGRWRNAVLRGNEDDVASARIPPEPEMPLRRTLTLPLGPVRASSASLHLAHLQGLSLDSCRLAGTAYGRKGRKTFRRARSALAKTQALWVLLDPLHPREPRRHASHKARHRGGPGAKEDVTEAVDTRAKKGIRACLERRGFEILEEGWAHGGDIADFIARDEGDLVFVSCQVTQSGGEGVPRGGCGPSGARTAGGVLPRRAPRLRGRPGQARRREPARRRRGPGASPPPPQRARHAVSAGRPRELRLPGAAGLRCGCVCS